MLGQKMYIITDAGLMQATQKQPKILTFLPIEAKCASKICGVSRNAEAAFFQNGDETAETNLLKETHAARRATLSPSVEFDDLNHQMLHNIIAFLREFKISRTQPARIGLSKWLRRSITTATTTSIYGPLNPFRDQEVVDAIW